MKISLPVRTGALLLILWGALLSPKSAGAVTLALAHYQDYKPYAYVDPNGRSRGMLIDIWRLWAEKNNVNLTFIPARLSRCLELVNKGEADIVIGLFRSAERAVYLDFSDPLIHNVDTNMYVKESLREREAIYARYGSFSPEPLIARYRHWFIGGAATLLMALVVIVFYSFRFRRRIVQLARRRQKKAAADWPAVIAEGEGDALEFKSTLRWNLRTEKVDKNLEEVIVKTISAFLNSAGGSLFIGVADDGTLLGLDGDYRSFQKRPNRDGFLLKLSSLISQAIGKAFHKFIQVEIRTLDSLDVCRITVAPADRPAFIKKKGNEAFYIRASAASVPLSLSESHKYISSRW